jgi:hypothetical protein
MFAAQSASAQVVWNPTTDFSLTNGNPNGVWTYGWMDTAFTTFYSDTGFPSVWEGYAGSNGPLIWLNGSASTLNGDPPGDIALHPGPGTQPSILRWTAPTGFSGTAHVSGQFLSGDTGEMLVAVRFNGSPVWSATDFGAFVFDRVFVAGDQLDFAVFGGYDYGTTPLEMSITSSAIPEPTTYAVLFGLAALGFVAYRRRRRQAV